MQRYRDLTAWQLAHQNSLSVFRYALQRWTPPQAVIFDQLRRAALSVHLNIAEGHASGVSARCKYHFRVAHASAVETTELLEFLKELGGEVDQMIAISIRVQSLTFRLWKRTHE